MKETIVRMPPSPTGHLHLGTARTALFNYLFAKKNNGKIIFRWEDTDVERSKSEFEAEIFEGLKWLGMDFEKESHQVLRQTENLDAHKEGLKKLWEAGKVFPCFVTPDEINQQRETAQKNKQNFVFWSPFRDEEKEVLEAKMKSGEAFAWRIKMPKDEAISFDDLIRGEVKIESKILGDFVVARSNGSVLYLLANVFDDLWQGITHVIRGEDHISNTPKQLFLWKALEEEAPFYAHIPLVLDSRRKKLSKRNVEPGVCVLIKDFQKEGFLQEAVVNGLAFLGWNPKTTEEIFTLAELEEIFTLKSVNPAAAQYDFEKMRWFNQQWMKKLSDQDLYKNFMVWFDAFSENKKALENFSEEKITTLLSVLKEKSKTFSEIFNEMQYFLIFENPQKNLLENPKMKVDSELAHKVLQEIAILLQKIEEADFNQDLIKEKSIEKIKEMELKNGQFLWPFRVSLSNRERSASPFEMAEILGKEETLKRINAFL